MDTLIKMFERDTPLAVVARASKAVKKAKKKFPIGAIIGIIIVVIIIIVVVCLVLFLLKRRKAKAAKMGGGAVQNTGDGYAPVGTPAPMAGGPGPYQSQVPQENYPMGGYNGGPPTNDVKPGAYNAPPPQQNYGAPPPQQTGTANDYYRN